MIKWFAANKLFLNLTNIMKFVTKSSSHSTSGIGYKKKVYRRDGKYKKFLD